MAAKKKKKTAKKVETKAAPKATKRGGIDRPDGVPVLPESGVDQAARKTAIRAYMSQFNQPDHKVIAFADEAPNTYELRRPCGIMSLDIDTGGGLPAGGLSMISGPDNAGKTFLSLKYMAMHQKLYGHDASMAFVTVEGAFDFKRARGAGVAVAIPDRMINQWAQERQIRGLPPFTTDELAWFKYQIGEFVVIRGSTGEEILQAVLSAVKHRLFNVIVVDSISVLLPDADAEKDVGEAGKRASRATLLTDFITKYTPTTQGLDGVNETTLIFLNQVRANSQKASAPAHLQKYLKDWESTGAWAVRHGKLVDVTIWDGGKIRKTVQGQDTIVGKELKWEISKGKAGTHDNRFGTVPFYYDFYLPQGTDDLDTIIVEGIRRGVILENKGIISVLRGETRAEAVIADVPGMTAFKKMMAADPQYELAVRREVLASAGIQCLYR